MTYSYPSSLPLQRAETLSPGGYRGTCHRSDLLRSGQDCPDHPVPQKDEGTSPKTTQLTAKFNLKLERKVSHAGGNT